MESGMESGEWRAESERAGAKGESGERSVESG